MTEARYRLRAAQPQDCPAILELIQELATYERMAGAVRATVSALEHSLFGSAPAAEVILAESPHEDVVGFALFFPNYSTFLAKSGIWLEDLYVKPDHRGHGVGSALFRSVAGLARERGCGRMEWSVLDWNRPAIDFYQRMGAHAQDEWTTWRLTGTALEALAQRR